jgi:hypothetical protein
MLRPWLLVGLQCSAVAVSSVHSRRALAGRKMLQRSWCQTQLSDNGPWRRAFPCPRKLLPL